MDGLSVVSVDGSHYAVMLVSDLEKDELTRLAGIVSLPLAQRLADATSIARRRLPGCSLRRLRN